MGELFVKTRRKVSLIISHCFVKGGWQQREIPVLHVFKQTSVFTTVDFIVCLNGSHSEGLTIKRQSCLGISELPAFTGKPR